MKLGEKYFLERVKVILLTTLKEKAGFDRESWRANATNLCLENRLANTYFRWIDMDEDNFISFKDIQEFLEREHSPRFALKRAFMKNLDDPQLFQQERTWECPWDEPPLSLEQGLLGTGLYVAEVCYAEPKKPKSQRKKRYLPGSPRRRKKRKTNLRLFKASQFTVPPHTPPARSFRSEGDVTTFHHASGMTYLPRSGSSALSFNSVASYASASSQGHHREPRPPSDGGSPPSTVADTTEAGAAPVVPGGGRHQAGAPTASTQSAGPPERSQTTAFPFTHVLVDDSLYDVTAGGGAPPGGTGDGDDSVLPDGHNGRPFTPPTPFSPSRDGPAPPPRSPGFGRTMSHPFLPRALSFSERKHEGLSPTERKILSSLLRRVPPGSLLTHVNETQVEHATLIELLRIITKAMPPYTLRFRLQRPDQELQDNIPPQLRFEANLERGGMLKNSDLNCWEKEHVLYDYKTPVDPVKAAMESPYFPHCKHCPLREAWYLRIHLTMEDESYSTLSFIVTSLVFVLIGISTVAFILETVPSLEGSIWVFTEWTVSLLFTLEYVIRFSVAREYRPYFIDPLNLIDFLSILPFWLERLLSALDALDVLDVSFLRVIRIIRLARIFRLLKDPRFDGISTFGVILVRTLSASLFAFYTLLSVVILLVVIFASIVYTIEVGTLEWAAVCGEFDTNLACDFPADAVLNDTAQCASSCLEECGLMLVNFADPKDGCCEWDPSTGGCHYWPETPTRTLEGSPKMAANCQADKIKSRSSEKGEWPPKPSPFVDIAEAMWWSTVTMFMVGYGELSPTNWIAQVVNTFLMLIGLLVLATPVIIMGFEYAVAMQRNYVIQAERNMLKGNDNWHKKMNEINACLGFNYFNRDSELAILKNGVPSTSRFQQFVGQAYNHGWAYLPFESTYVPGTPRLNQWQNFILHEYYGRKFADVEKRRAGLSRWASALGLSLEERKKVDPWITNAPRKLPPELYDPLQNGFPKKIQKGNTTKGGPDTEKELEKNTRFQPELVAERQKSDEKKSTGTSSSKSSTWRTSQPGGDLMEAPSLRDPSLEDTGRRESGFWIHRQSNNSRSRKSGRQTSPRIYGEGPGTAPLLFDDWPDREEAYLANIVMDGFLELKPP